MKTINQLSIIFLSIILSFPALSQGTKLEGDIFPGISSSDPQYLTVFNGKLYFSAFDGHTGGGHGRELWVHDGKSAALVADVYPGYLSSNPSDLAVYDSKLFFSATDGTHGEELWCHDGDSTYMVEDFIPGNTSFSAKNMIVYDSSLYFKSSYGGGLFSYDGDSIRYETSGGNGDYCVAFNKLFMGYGNGLASYDGDSFRIEFEIDTNVYSGQARNLYLYDSAIYFSAYDAIQEHELWKFDGTSAQLVADICPGCICLNFDCSHPRGFQEYKGKLYFTATYNGSAYDDLYIYDGTTLIKTGLTFSGNMEMIVHDDLLYISGSGHCILTSGFGDYSNCNFVSYDEINFETVFVGPPGLSIATPSQQSWLVNLDGKIFFSGYDGVSGYELWSYRSDTLCKLPINHHTVVNSETNVTLNWDKEVNATAYVIRGKEINSLNFSTFTISDALSNSIEINGLVPWETYVWQIKAVCNSFGTESAYSDFDTFYIADSLCYIPEPITTTDITSNSAVLRWTPVTAAEGYRILGKEITSTSVLSLYIPAPQDSLFVNLASNKTYGWQIRAECGGINNSFYTYPEIFTTSPGQVPKNGGEFDFPRCIVYPNPFSNYTIIESFHEVIDQIDVYDLQGRLIKTINPNSNQYKLYRDQFSSGIFVIIILSSKGKYTQKLIIE